MIKTNNLPTETNLFYQQPRSLMILYSIQGTGVFSSVGPPKPFTFLVGTYSEHSGEHLVLNLIEFLEFLVEFFQNLLEFLFKIA